ncbi:MAG: hypothetical protein J4N81_05010 [Chloroflexi bacterium]|nr:hypothetical protein [Chloroflexota bacterium]
MLESDELHLNTIDPLLADVIRENQEKVVGWMRGEPGCWGFLAGNAVTSCRHEMGRTLEDQERRLVWRRLWWLLEQIKAQALS